MQEPILQPERDFFVQEARAIELLKGLIAIPSFSREEDTSAELIQQYLAKKMVACSRFQNNIWAKNKNYNSTLPTILLNSHHDTVKPNTGYTMNPFEPVEKEGRIYGLGSNDAGASLVSLLTVFLHYYDREDLPYNLIFAATAEEEVSGVNGIECLLPQLGTLTFGIVGEPTSLRMAIAEKGLMVLDCMALGKAGHAAHGDSDNAIYKAMQDIEWFRTYQFPKRSDLLGPVKMNVTIVNAGSAHNVVPGTCSFTVDVRTTDSYSNPEILDIIKEHVSCEVTARSLRLRPSFIEESHPLVQAARRLNIETYGSPTISDQTLMPFPTVKIGPGDSMRSHSSDEYVEINEIRKGIRLYIDILDAVFKHEN